MNGGDWSFPENSRTFKNCRPFNPPPPPRSKMFSHWLQCVRCGTFQFSSSGLQKFLVIYSYNGGCTGCRPMWKEHGFVFLGYFFFWFCFFFFHRVQTVTPCVLLVPLESRRKKSRGVFFSCLSALVFIIMVDLQECITSLSSPSLPFCLKVGGDVLKEGRKLLITFLSLLFPRLWWE